MEREFTDTELLDFLQEQTNKAAYTGKVICRRSSTGRGWRLHESSLPHANGDVREAIMEYMEKVRATESIRFIENKIKDEKNQE
jgi:hypothetical protein